MASRVYLISINKRSHSTIVLYVDEPKISFHKPPLRKHGLAGMSMLMISTPHGEHGGANDGECVYRFYR